MTKFKEIFEKTSKASLELNTNGIMIATFKDLKTAKEAEKWVNDYETKEDYYVHVVPNNADADYFRSLKDFQAYTKDVRSRRKK